MKRLGHVPALDGLRGIAILLVLGVHAYAPLVPGGQAGVDLFFVLSGFLITKLAFEEHDKTGRLSLGAFYSRRAFRLLPALLLLLAVLGVLSVSMLDSIGSTIRMEIFFALFFLSNTLPVFLGNVERPTLGHTWSLGLEEQFYLFWPLLLVTVRSAFQRPMVFARWVLVISLALALVGRLGVFGLLSYPHWGSIPLFNVDGLAFGCVLAIYVHCTDRSLIRLPRERWFWAAWILIAVHVLTVDKFYVDTLKFHTLPLRALFALVLLFVVCGAPRAGVVLLGNPLLRFFGKISYSLYLWHAVVFMLLSSDRYPSVGRAPLFVARLAVSLAAAVGSYYLLEQPALRFRKARVDPWMAARERERSHSPDTIVQAADLIEDQSATRPAQLASREAGA